MNRLTAVADRELKFVLARGATLDGAILREFPDEKTRLQFVSAEVGVLDLEPLRSDQFTIVFDAIRALTSPPARSSERIGFRPAGS